MNQYNDRDRSSSITSALGKIFSLEKLNQEPTPEELERYRKLREEDDMLKREADLWNQFRMLTSLSKRDAETKRWANLKIDSDELAAVVRKVKAWSPDCGYGLFLHGDPGPGKTHMLKALILDHFSISQTFKFVSVPDLVEEMRNYAHRETYHGELSTPFGLVLDDFGAEQFGTESADLYAQKQLFRILEHRKELGKHVFMTSNLSARELVVKYDQRIVSRLGEMMAFIEVKAPSHRKVIYINNQADLERRAMLAGGEG